MPDRIQKEKDFHNNRFASETRESLDKYYSISYLINDYYQDNLFKKCKGKRILEYGCGLGGKSFELSKYAREVVAIDISEIAIDKLNTLADERNIKNVTFNVMNAESLNFPENNFDVVCGVSILHHLDLQKSYSELSRVLKPGGKAYFIEPLGHNPIINLYRNLTPSLRTEDEHPLLKKDLELLKKYFNDVDIKYYFLTSLLAIPFRKTSHFNKVVNFFNVIDQSLFKINFFEIPGMASSNRG